MEPSVWRSHGAAISSLILGRLPIIKLHCPEDSRILTWANFLLSFFFRGIYCISSERWGFSGIKMPFSRGYVSAAEGIEITRAVKFIKYLTLFLKQNFNTQLEHNSATCSIH